MEVTITSEKTVKKILKRLDLHQCSVIKLTGDMEVRSFFYARK